MSQALLYEIQPIRASQVPDIAQRLKMLWTQVCQTVPVIAGALVSRIQKFTMRQWLWLGAAILYYLALRWLHHFLDAGPIVLIISALVGIFTIGLGDEENDTALSAYSVFNRGFQRLLGEVEAEDLVAQQLGRVPAPR
jgi:hypothetical protein